MPKFIKEADNVAGDILKDFRDPLIAVGRVLLVSTFIEDGKSIGITPIPLDEFQLRWLKIEEVAFSI